MTPGLLAGTLFALAAGLMWGLVFVGPLLLPDYPAVLQSFGRYLAFGLIALPLGWLDRARLAQLTRADWLEALKLAAIGNVIYYLFLASAIQRAGGPLPTMIIGTLPVVIAVCSNLRGGGVGGAPLAWGRLLPSLLLIGTGILLVNHAELAQLRAEPQADLRRYAIGAALAVGAVICWTWYPLRNADWLRAHPDRSPRSWATAQGLATLPLALVGYAGTWAWMAWHGNAQEMPFGPRPAVFIGLMFAIGLFASWLGTLCWNEASQRLPTALAGQLIVFETLSALAYAFVLRGHWPQPQTLAGAALLIGGVMWALRSGPARHATSRRFYVACQAGRAPGRPKPAPASRETRLALRPSKPAQAGLEPRPTFPSGDRPVYPPGEGSSCSPDGAQRNPGAAVE